MIFTSTLIAAGILYVGATKLQQRLTRPTPTHNQDPQSNTSDAEAHKKSEDEAALNRDLTVAATALVTSTGGLYFPMLSAISVPGIIWVCVIETRDAYQAHRQGRGFGADALAAVFEIGAILTGHFFAAALGAAFGRLSKKLLSKTEDRSKANLINMFSAQNANAWLVKDGIEVLIPVEEIRTGDIISVSAGEWIPADGTILDGSGIVDQQVLTGESKHFEKRMGDGVYASTMLLSGKFTLTVERSGQETVADQVAQILAETTDFKETIQSQGEALADRSARVTVLLSLATFPLFGATTALTVLNSSLGFYMRVLGPISMLSYLNVAAQNGLLIKDGRSLQLLATVDTIVFDKTGTLTLEQPQITAIHASGPETSDSILSYAAAAEAKQAHPIAAAIRAAAQKRELEALDVEHVEVLMGQGLRATVCGRQILLGSIGLLEESNLLIPPDLQPLITNASSTQGTRVFIAIDGQVQGLIELCTLIRPEAKTLISELHRRGLKTYIISGDHPLPTQELAEELGIDDYFAEALPEDKSRLIGQLQSQGKSICFVGDGINDSLALKHANVSVSLRGASTVATDTAQIVLMNGQLSQLLNALDVANRFDKNMRLNYLATTAPGLLTLYGAFFLHFGVLASVVLNDLGIVVGASNALLPWLRQSEQNARHPQNELEHPTHNRGRS